STTCADALLLHKRSISVVRRTRAEGNASVSNGPTQPQGRGTTFAGEGRQNASDGRVAALTDKNCWVRCRVSRRRWSPAACRRLRRRGLMPKSHRHCGKRAYSVDVTRHSALKFSARKARSFLPADQADSKGSCMAISGKSPIGPHPPAGHARIALSVIGARFTRALSFANRCQADCPRGGAIAVVG